MDAVKRVVANNYKDMFANQVEIITRAMETMLTLDNECDHRCGVELFNSDIGSYEDGVSAYPFSKSFDELLCEVSSWLYVLKNNKF